MAFNESGGEGGLHPWDVVDYEGKAHAMVGADSGLGCIAAPRGQKFGVSIEVYSYDGDAEKGCKDSGWLCSGIVDESGSKGNTIIFSGNVMLVVYAGADIANALLEDLQK